MRAVVARTKKRAGKKPIDWFRIKRLMLKSFTGGGLTSEELDEIQAAYKAAPKQYSKLHAEVKAAEVARLRSM